MASTSPAADAALQYANKHRDEFLEGLKDLLRIPSISTLPRHKKDIQKAAKFVADALEDAGLKKVKLIKTDGHPLVYGEWLEAPGKPTVLLYGHYDVQPVDPIGLWQSKPFEPEVRGENLYARGAVDDKGQVSMWLGAFRAWHQQGGIPCGITVLIE
ncbi:MAG: M20/M25/M40 family metallo-hydrolase, partial [Ktedonobacterales bacterium]